MPHNVTEKWWRDQWVGPNMLVVVRAGGLTICTYGKWHEKLFPMCRIDWYLSIENKAQNNHFWRHQRAYFTTHSFEREYSLLLTSVWKFVFLSATFIFFFDFLLSFSLTFRFYFYYNRTNFQLFDFKVYINMLERWVACLLILFFALVNFSFENFEKHLSSALLDGYRVNSESINVENLKADLLDDDDVNTHSEWLIIPLFVNCKRVMASKRKIKQKTWKLIVKTYKLFFFKNFEIEVVGVVFDSLQQVWGFFSDSIFWK
jgi:hypothetical protein